MKRILLFLVVLVFAVTACTNQPQQPQDLSALQTRLDNVAGRIDALRADVQQLQSAALQLDANVRVNTNLSTLLGGLTGVVVESWPPDLDVWIESGACPEDLPDGSFGFSASAVGTSFHSVAAGTYCVGIPETDTIEGAGQTVTVPDGVIVWTSLAARNKEGTP